MDRVKIFLSYCWKDSKEADKICKYFKNDYNIEFSGKLSEDLKRRQDISSNIAEFLGVVSDMNNPNINDICEEIEKKLGNYSA